jgi:hypothetical protein
MAAPSYVQVVSATEAAKARVWLGALAVFASAVVVSAVAHIVLRGNGFLVATAACAVVVGIIREVLRLVDVLRRYRFYQPVAGRIVGRWHQAVIDVPPGHRDSNSLFDVRFATVRAPAQCAVTYFLRIVPRAGGAERTVIVSLETYLYVVTYDVRDYDPNDPID